MEPITPPYFSAPVWRRIAAIVYDSFLVTALLFLAGFINLGLQVAFYGSETLKEMTDNGYTLDSPLFYGLIFLTIYGFFGFFWTTRGQTLGMQAWRLKIIDAESHELITKQRSLIRFLIAIPSIALAGAGILWSLIDGHNRSWQDMASASRTVLLPKQP